MVTTDMNPTMNLAGGGAVFPTSDEPLVDESLVTRFPAFGAFPDATRQAFLGLPYLLIWEAVKPGASSASAAGSPFDQAS